jgi:hypothetical protein
VSIEANQKKKKKNGKKTNLNGSCAWISIGLGNPFGPPLVSAVRKECERWDWRVWDRVCRDSLSEVGTS